MEREDLIAKAVRIVKSNSKSLRIVLSATGKYSVVTDQKTFSINNKDSYTEEEIKEIFERKKYTGVRVSLLEVPIPGYSYLDINDIPDAESIETPPTSTSTVYFYNFGSNKGNFYIKEDSETPYSKDAFERLLTRRFSDLEISTFNAGVNPVVEEKNYQSLSQFISAPKYTSSERGDFDDSDKTFYYKVDTSYGLFLLKNRSREVLDENDIKLVIKRNFRDVLIVSLLRSMSSPHTGYTESDYQTFAEFNKNPRDVNSSPSETENIVEIITNQTANMDPPPNPLSVMLSRDISYLPTDIQRTIASHRTNYWVAHKWLRDGLKRYGIGPSTTVASLPVEDRDTGEILINLYDDILSGTVTEKQLIDRIKVMQNIYSSRSEERASDFAEMFFGKKRK